MKDCGTCYYRNSTWSLQNREISASCEHGNAPSDALLKLRIGAGSVVRTPVWCPLEEEQKPMTCNHQWSAEPHEGLGSHYCHNCNEWEIEVNYDRALHASGIQVDFPVGMCEHDWLYLGGHNELWVCRKCGVRERR